MQVKKQQLELDMGQQTGLKFGKEYAKAELEPQRISAYSLLTKPRDPHCQIRPQDWSLSLIHSSPCKHSYLGIVEMEVRPPQCSVMANKPHPSSEIL